MTLSSIAIILWVSTILGFIVFNLYQKNVKMERTLIEQNTYIQNMRSSMGEIESLINKIDMTMWVQTDPELLQLFESLKNLHLHLKQFTKNVN
jgi:hypothetical protein